MVDFFPPLFEALIDADTDDEDDLAETVAVVVSFLFSRSLFACLYGLTMGAKDFASNRRTASNDFISSIANALPPPRCPSLMRSSTLVRASIRWYNSDQTCFCC